jgi:hypothetical protein
LRLVHADADPIAGNARLRHLKHGGPDPIAITDAHLVVGQPVDGRILPELLLRCLAAAPSAGLERAPSRWRCGPSFLAKRCRAADPR